MNLLNKIKKYKTDKNTVYSCQYHVIFCPKYRRAVLTENVAKRLKEILTERALEYGGEILECSIMEDHVHLLVSVSPKIGIYKMISILKGSSGNMLRKEFKEIRTKLPCMWSGSRFISTVGEVSLEVVQKYIEEQKGK